MPPTSMAMASSTSTSLISTFELNRLYHNNGDGTFTDVTYSSGIGNKAMLLSGVAAKFVDYDNDGWPDIVQANGAMVDNVSLYHSEVSYKEPLLMFHNLGNGHFEKSSDSLGPDFMHPVAGRGLATADFDNDGAIGFAVVCRGDYPELLRNDGGDSQSTGSKFSSSAPNPIATASAPCSKLTAEGFVAYEQAKGGIQLHVGKRSAHSFRPRKAHQNRFARDHLAQRTSG